MKNIFRGIWLFYTVQNPSKSVNEISYFAIKSEEEYVGLTGGSSNGFDFSNEMIFSRISRTEIKWWLWMGNHQNCGDTK